MPSPASADLQVISLRCVESVAGGSSEWHAHPFEELVLIADDSTTSGHAASRIRVKPDTLLLFRRGERHGRWNGRDEAPRFWVLHFKIVDFVAADMAQVFQRDAASRAWHLTADQATTFKWLFVRVLTEQSCARCGAARAASAWLQLLLVNLQRWAVGGSGFEVRAQPTNGELLDLWHLANRCIGQPLEFAARVRALPNYDSLRQAFKREFGCAPGQMIMRQRLQLARNLLLETQLSIKEIAARIGYARQHEFARAFHRALGQSPSDWRAHPVDPGSKTGLARSGDL